MNGRTAFVLGAVLCLGVADIGEAQEWTGGYVAGSVGGVFPGTADTESVNFDTTLDGTFTDTVTTLAGANAFSPGFCGGLAVNATAAAGCTDDERGLDVGGRAGYDWQWGRMVAGGLVDLSRQDSTDYVTAFSTTPAFYTFARRSQMSLGIRGRAGVVAGPALVYGTAGPAWARIGQRFTSSNTANAFVPVEQTAEVDDDGFAGESVWGYQAGGGAEVRVAAHMTIGAEYLYANFDNREVSTIRSTRGTAPATNPFVLTNPAGTDLRRTDALRLHAVRAMLSIRF